MINNSAPLIFSYLLSARGGGTNNILDTSCDAPKGVVFGGSKVTVRVHTSLQLLSKYYQSIAVETEYKGVVLEVQKSM